LKLFRIAWLALAACMGVAIAARMLFGPFRSSSLLVTVPLNPEGLFGLAITVLLLMQVSSQPLSETRGRWILPAIAVAAVTIFALRRSLGIYFLSDDFIVVKYANQWTAASFPYLVTHGGGDGFFRPFGFVVLAFVAKWAGLNPVLWHAWALALHAVSSVLVMLLARRLGASVLAAAFAGMLFGIHGTRPEAAVWIAGQFDLLATFFVLAGFLLFTLLFTLSGTHDRRVRYTLHAAALACFALAAVSKESAFIFPLFVAGYVLWKRWPLASSAPYFALAAFLFAYRWSLFGGIGGYIDSATGLPAALSLGFGSTLKAVAIRLWTSLYFPINWSGEASLPLALLAIAYMGALLWLALRSRPAQPLWPAVIAILIACIPPLSLLSGSPTLAGSRVLYLPSVWFAILLALAVDGLSGRARYAVAAIALLFHFAALQHNLDFWEEASAQVRAACAADAPDLPPFIQGVPAFANGRQECIEMGHTQSGRP
jgi:hypothetical protein